MADVFQQAVQLCDSKKLHVRERVPCPECVNEAAMGVEVRFALMEAVAATYRVQRDALIKAVKEIPVNHRHDCPKVKPRRDTMCSLGVLHLGHEDSRCDCFAEQTQAAIDAILSK